MFGKLLGISAGDHNMGSFMSISATEGLIGQGLGRESSNGDQERSSVWT